MAVTQKDIAQHLGVSRPWVSRALRGDPVISATARARVAAAARELGYSPLNHAAARELAERRHGRTVRSGVIGCTDFGRGNLPYWAHLFRGIQEVAHRENVDVLMMPTQFSEGWARVDGVLAYGEGGFECLGSLPMRVPQVAVIVPLQGVASVVADDFCGARLATEHLLELGHRRIGFLALVQSTFMRRRLDGFHAALREAGITESQKWVRPVRLEIESDSLRELGRRNARQWLQSDWRQLGLTALLVQNDEMAVGVMQALNEAGLRVPGDVSVIGFDSTELCEMCSPRLTSVQIPLERIGARAMELLLRQIREEHTETTICTLPVQLDVRDSTGVVV